MTLSTLTHHLDQARTALTLDHMGAVILEPWRRKYASDEYKYASLQLDSAIGRKWEAGR